MANALLLDDHDLQHICLDWPLPVNVTAIHSKQFFRKSSAHWKIPLQVESKNLRVLFGTRADWESRANLLSLSIGVIEVSLILHSSSMTPKSVMFANSDHFSLSHSCGPASVTITLTPFVNANVAFGTPNVGTFPGGASGRLIGSMLAFVCLPTNPPEHYVLHFARKPRNDTGQIEGPISSPNRKQKHQEERNPNQRQQKRRKKDNPNQHHKKTNFELLTHALKAINEEMKKQIGRHVPDTTILTHLLDLQTQCFQAQAEADDVEFNATDTLQILMEKSELASEVRARLSVNLGLEFIPPVPLETYSEPLPLFYDSYQLTEDIY